MPHICPGGPAINVDRERWVAQCPHCTYTFSTLMDEPMVPPHYVSTNGVTFGPVGLAALPHLTYDELGVLLDAVETRMSLPGGARSTLGSLATTVAEAMFMAEVDAKRRALEAEDG